jgi:polyphosphate kinase 2 (PPK2 family)
MGNGADQLAQVDVTQKLSKKAYKQIKKAQLERLYELENECFERGIPVIVVFEGWDAAGKGTSIRALTERLDPRGFKVLSTQAPRTHEKQKPWLWRFWMDIPRRGQMAIFDRSWYGRVLVERVRGLTPIPDWIRAYEEINAFERNLADDGTVIIKFWLHMTKEEQLRRFIRLTQDPDTAWQVTVEDWENHGQYDEYLAAVEDMLTNTHTEYGPWAVIPATSMHYKTYSLLSALIARLETALDFEVTRWPTAAELEAQVGKKKVKAKAKTKAKAEGKRKGKGTEKGTQKRTQKRTQKAAAGDGEPRGEAQAADKSKKQKKGSEERETVVVADGTGKTAVNGDRAVSVEEDHA